MEVKKCKVCGRELPFENFKKNHLAKDGRVDVCNDCVALKRQNAKILNFDTPPPQNERDQK